MSVQEWKKDKDKERKIRKKPKQRHKGRCKKENDMKNSRQKGKWRK
jgi:hypothetical protein